MILDKLNRVLESSNGYYGDDVIEDVTVDELFESAILEPSKDYYRLQSALFMTDIQLEESALNTRMDSYLGEPVTESVSEIEILAEAAGTGFKEKAKRIFQTIKEKVVAWVKKAGAFISSFFLSGEKFLKKYESEIRAKDANLGTRFKCKLPTITYYSIVSGAKKVKALENNVQGYITSLSSGGFVPENTEAVCSALYKDTKNLSELKEALTKVFEPSNTKEEGRPIIEDSIKIIKTFGKAYLKSLKESEKNIKRECDRCIAIIKSAKDDEKLNDKVKYAKFAVNCATTGMGVEYSMVKKAGSQHEAVLKKLLRAKSASQPEGRYVQERPTNNGLGLPQAKEQQKATKESFIGFSMDIDEFSDYSEI